MLFLFAVIVVPFPPVLKKFVAPFLKPRKLLRLSTLLVSDEAEEDEILVRFLSLIVLGLLIFSVVVVVVDGMVVARFSGMVSFPST